MSPARRESRTSSASDMPDQVDLTDPWVSRYFRSQLLDVDNGPAGSSFINCAIKEVYGSPTSPMAFKVGNGGAGFTGILRALCETFIARYGNDFSIGWVANHSRHTQIALLADVVQVALTYEPSSEDISIQEGWAKRIGRVFNDHFILVGPIDTVLGVDTTIEALDVIATRRLAFHSRGDGSATWTKEQSLMKAAGIGTSAAGWVETYPLSPFEALRKADKEQAFLLTDRSTFLSTQKTGAVRSLRAHVDGGEELMNPCSVLVRSSLDKSELAVSFAQWLCRDEAQDLIQHYGTGEPQNRLLFTPACQEEFSSHMRLAIISSSSRL